MNLDVFLKSFRLSGNNCGYLNQYDEVGSVTLSKLPELRELFALLSGSSFENGLFKIHTIGSFYFWTEVAFEYFKKYKGHSYCFAFDWVGRQYAVNYSDGRSLILMLDQATAEVFELEGNIESFLSDGIDDFKIDVLELQKFRTLTDRSLGLKFGQCFGFKQFLFLGGKDEVNNYEAIDMEVYWELNYQIYAKTNDLPGGALISDVNIQ